MTLDWWGLGLQAVNVVILVWLLGRIFWRPVAEAITRRQQASEAMLDKGKAAQEQAEATLADLTKARAGLAAERETALAEARAAADSAAAATLAGARTQAEALLVAAQAAIARDRDHARKENASKAAALSVEISAKLLARFNTDPVRAAFLALLIKAIADLTDEERAALGSTAEIEIISATDPDPAEQAEIARAVAQAIGQTGGATPRLRFTADPALIAGLELRTAHFALRNSWRADLDRLLKEIKDAA